VPLRSFPPSHRCCRLEAETQSLSKSFATLEFTNQSLANQISKYSEEREAIEEQLFALREQNQDSESEKHQLKSTNNRWVPSIPPSLESSVQDPEADGAPDGTKPID
jgi:chromosome segregation ATPase